MDELRAALESETLQKVDCQNNLQSLREEIEFQKKVHEEVRKKDRRNMVALTGTEMTIALGGLGLVCAIGMICYSEISCIPVFCNSIPMNGMC